MKTINQLETELAALKDKWNSPLSVNMSDAEITKLESRIIEVEEEISALEEKYCDRIPLDEQEYRSNILAPQFLSLNRRAV